MRPAAATAALGRGHGGHSAVTAAQPTPGPRQGHLLAWAFTLFNSLRVLSYGPTICAIHASGRSDQYSIWTWIVWLGANTTMALWLYEQAGHRLNRVVLVNGCNSTMCLTTLCVIVAYRF